MNFYFLLLPFRALPTHRKYNKILFCGMRIWNGVFKKRSRCLQFFCKITALKISFFNICRETPTSESLFKENCLLMWNFTKSETLAQVFSCITSDNFKHIYHRTLPVDCFCKCVYCFRRAGNAVTTTEWDFKKERYSI